MTLEQTIIADIQRLTKAVIDNAAKAGLVGGEWEQVTRRVNQCTILERMATSRPYTAPELHTFLGEVQAHHTFIMATVNKKRRPHPERSRRGFP